MKIVIVGYGEMFKSIVAGVLATKNDIVGVFREDRVKKNKIKLAIDDILNPSDDYNFIRTHNLPEIIANSVNSEKFIAKMNELKPDIILVCSWSEKFSIQTINTAKMCCINVHPSMLPKYRGPNPYIQTILNGEKSTGITFHIMDVNYDTGSILYQMEVPILTNDTGGSLKFRCCDAARNHIPVLLHNLNELLKKQESQNEESATYQHQISLSETILDFNKETAFEIDRRIRAMSPWQKCHIPYKNQFFTFDKYKICNNPTKAGSSSIVKIKDDELYIACKDKKVIKFTGLHIKRPFSKIITKIYMTKIIKIKDKAV